MKTSTEFIHTLVQLRHDLHKHPELSGKETNTPLKIKEFVARYNPNHTIESIGGNGIAFTFEGNEKGETVVIRADIDALPIQETNTFDHKSTQASVSHKCGHDGHTAIVAGLAETLSQKPIKKGKVVLFFQAAEETGQGALKTVNDKKFLQLNPDYVFGLHNLPGFPKGSMILKANTFAAASTGVIIKLKGKTSHAAEPENGISPAIAIADIMKELTYLPHYNDFNDLVVSTVIYCRLGEIAFGTSPGYGEIMATLRAFDKGDFQTLKEKALSIAENHATISKLKLETEFVEEFPTTINTNKGVELLKSIAKEQNIQVIEKTEAFRWSEDFGHYLERYKGTFFGLGSGLQHPQLHNPHYDFPDEIITDGLIIFNSIIDKFNR